MSFKIEYGPSAASVGSLGALIGSGQARRENSQMQNDFARQALGVMLQDRNAQNQYNLQLAGMLNTEAARANQWQQQQFDNQMAQQQMQMQGQQFEQRQQLAFAELDQQQQIREMRGRPQASAEWQSLMGKQQYLDQALGEGFITPEQHQQYAQRLAQEAAGFDPHKFPYEGAFEPGRDMGDVWQDEVVMPFGTFKVNRTRDRSGMPVMTDDSKIFLEAAAKAHYDQQKAQAGKAVDAPKPAVTMSDYAKMYQSISESLSTVDPNTGATIPANPAAVDTQMQKMVEAYRRQFGTEQPGGGWGGVPLRVTGEQQPQPQGEAGWSDMLLRPTDPKPTAERLPWNPNEQPNTPQDMQFLSGPTVETPLTKLLPNFGNMPAPEVATLLASGMPQFVQQHLQMRYPPGAGAEVTDPLDLALFTELRAMKERALRTSGTPAATAPRRATNASKLTFPGSSS